MGTTVAPAKDTAPAAVIYAAKSTADPRGSIDTQVADCLAAVEAGGRELIAEPFRDEAASASKGDRGPGLAAAIAAAKTSAAEHGEAELWVQHSDRLARGSGKKGEARHLAALYFECLAVGVRLRSVQDDHNLEDAIRAVLIGERNHEDSARKSAATAAGLKRTAERGQWAGGRVPDGYVKLPREEGEPRRLALDPERSRVIERSLALGLRGLTSGAAARELNAAGLQARKVVKGGFELMPWTAWRVRKTWALAFYAGFVVHHGQIIGEGEWPRLIEAGDWYRLQHICAARADAVRQKGRPGQRRTQRHLLAGLGRCGRCGSPMHAFANSPRADGTRSRGYRCAAATDAAAVCDAPRIPAEIIERPFLAQLDALAVDLDGWIRERAGALEADRGAVAKSVEAAEGEVARLAAEADRVRGDYRRQLAAGHDGAAQVAADALADVARDREQAEHRAAELRAVLDAAGEASPAGDDVLDLYADLQRALAGHVAGDSVAEVNARLREAVDRVVMDPQADGSVVLRAYLAPAFMATVETDPEAFAAAYAANMGLPAEVDGDDVAVRLDAPPMRPVEVQQMQTPPPWRRCRSPR
jgi:DNA invertase Pin-like site-specific DNA recombinase